MNYHAFIKDLKDREINITKLYIANYILLNKDLAPFALYNAVEKIYNIYIDSINPDLDQIITDYLWED